MEKVRKKEYTRKRIDSWSDHSLRGDQRKRQKTGSWASGSKVGSRGLIAATASVNFNQKAASMLRLRLPMCVIGFDRSDLSY